MIEERGDLWTLRADARCVTTNGEAVGEGKKRHAVMGRGVALQATQRWPDLAHHFAELLDKYSNRPMKLRLLEDGSWLCSFPVKEHWRDKADESLIMDSAFKLQDMADKFGWQRVVIPRPGCGNGGLDWEYVRDLLMPFLDDRFVVAIPCRFPYRDAQQEPDCGCGNTEWVVARLSRGLCEWRHPGDTGPT
jgi:hypothetical protein